MGSLLDGKQIMQNNNTMIDLENEIATAIQREIDGQILADLIKLQREHEENLRAKYPALQKAWEEYQVILKLVQSHDDGELNT